MSTRTIRYIHCALASVVLLVYFWLTGWDNLFAVVSGFLFMMSPLPVNVLVTFFAKTRTSQFILLGGTIAYAAWAGFLYGDVMSSTDGQAGFVLLLTAIAATPVLLVLWLACLIVELMQRKKVPNGAVSAAS